MCYVWWNRNVKSKIWNTQNDRVTVKIKKLSKCLAFFLVFDDLDLETPSYLFLAKINFAINLNKNRYLGPKVLKIPIHVIEDGSHLLQKIVRPYSSSFEVIADRHIQYHTTYYK